MARSRQDEVGFQMTDVCRKCGRAIIWYVDPENFNLLSARRRRKGRKMCFVCISQAMQAKYSIRMLERKGVKGCGTT